MCAQRQGELAVAQPKGSPPPPPFERWSFRKRRYVQYLRDQLEVHAVMETAISAAVGDDSAQDPGTHADAASSPTARLARSSAVCPLATGGCPSAYLLP